MKQKDRTSKQARGRSARLGATAVGLLCLGLLVAAPASAGFEQVGNFAGTPGALHRLVGGSTAEWPEEVQLGGLGGMAINRTGAGGVSAGTLYAATAEGRVARFNPDGSFSERWTFQGSPPERRCGPEGDPAQPVCQSQPAGAAGTADVEVDQSTGNVYVFKDGSPGTNLIHVYNADGSALIAEFGERAATGETVAASPGKIHEGSAYGGSLAVDGAGNVYVSDHDADSYHRLMEFTPQSPGDYEHYVYAGQSHDVWPGFGFETPSIASAVFDVAGNVYVSNEEYVARLDPSQPSDPLLCEFTFTNGGIESMTVDPESGEAFFYTYKDKNKVRRLGPSCNGGGKLTEAGVIAFSPKRVQIGGMAFNPTRQYGPSRPAGVLYIGAPGSEGGKTEGAYPSTLVESSLGYIFARPVEAPPEVVSESVAHVTTTTAELGTRINPKGSATRYAFQYITEAQYEANEPSDRFAGAQETPLGGAFLGEGAETISAGASLTGLVPDTAYRYRALAISHCSSEDPEKACEGTGTPESFRTFPAEAPGLRDRRAWELVSPVQKHGGQVLPADPRIGSCFGEGECKPGLVYEHFPMQSTADGNAIVYEGTAFDAEQSALSENEYVARRDPRAGWQTTTPTPTLLFGRSDNGYKVFDTEFTQGVLQQFGTALSPEAPAAYDNLYTQPTANPLALRPLFTAEPPNRPVSGFKLRYVGASADLSRVFFEANDALTEETPFAPEAVDGGADKRNLYEWSGGQLALVNVMPGNTATQPGATFGVGSAHTISEDGARAFWSDEAGQVYVREDGEGTREIPGPGKFLSAATGGSKVLLSNGHLYDLDAETTTDLSEGKGGFQGIAGQSDDLSHVYFVDTAILTGEEENSEGAKAQAGKNNFYAWDEGGATFIATLSPGDNGNGSSYNIAHDWISSPSNRTAEASPHGRFVAFLSQAPLSGYDNTGPCESDHLGGLVSAPCPEVFIYDSATGELRCASCNPSGERPLGWTVLRLIQGPTYLPQARYLSDEGRLFFDSQDSLVPADTNRGVEDVYQYEPEGLGTCERASGCVSLISAGTGIADSNFLAADPLGKNAFFTTRDQLVLKDKDELIDLYDARVEGGTPAETEVARGECQGEACQAVVSPPNDPTPGSSTFEGAGNVDEKKAAKKHKKKQKKAKKHKAAKRGHGRAANNNRGGAK